MTKLYSIRKNSALAAIFFASLLTPTAYAETELDNEFWVSSNTNTANLGTLDNPFDGSTAAKFDTVMNSLPPNSTIRILAGTYQTRGVETWAVKSGQKILGSGMDVTVLQLVSGSPSEEMVGSVSGPCTNIEVADLTCDCNYTSGPYTYSGVEIDGTGTVIRRVKVVNQACFGPLNNGEAWGISANGYDVANSVGNIIEDCEVSHFAGGGISALTISAASGVIRDNHVFLAVSPGGSPVTGGSNEGINGSDVGSLLIEGNYIEGADSGVYGDTQGCTNVIITHNHFVNCEQGITYYGSQRRNITIAFNDITLAPNGIAAFNLWNGSNPDVSITNVVITGNTIDLAQQYTGTPFVIGAANVTGLLFYGNTINANLASNQMVEGATRFLGNKNVYMYDNYDLFGNPLTTFCQSPPCTKSFSILPPNGYVDTWGGPRGVTDGQIVSLSGNGFLGWNCASNANAEIIAALPLPNDYWDGKTNYITSWKLWTTNAGTFMFNTGVISVYTNGTSDMVQGTVSFTAPTGTNITTVAVTNRIRTASVENFQALIYTADKIQPGNYAILNGKVTGQ